MIIRLKVFEQTLSVVDTKSIPRKGSKDYLVLHFLFSSDWKDLDKLCYLQKDEVSQPIDVVDGLVEVPEWFTQQDSFDVTLFGTNSSQEVPTNVVALRMENSNTLWEQDAPEPQPGWLAKVIDLNNHPSIPGENGYWLIWDTDSGAYVESELPLPPVSVGPKGDKGDTGEQGPQGEQGPKGDKGDTGDTGPAGAGMDITGATVGQIAKITAVDASGVPTAWSPVDMPSGGGGETWELLSDTTIDEDVAVISTEIPPCKKIKAYFEGHQVYSDGSETSNKFTNLAAGFDVDGKQDLRPFYALNLISRFNSDVVSVIDFDVSTPPFASGVINRIFPNGQNLGNDAHPVSNEIAITAESAITKITIFPHYQFVSGVGNVGRFSSGGRFRVYGVRK